MHQRIYGHRLGCSAIRNSRHDQQYVGGCRVYVLLNVQPNGWEFALHELNRLYLLRYRFGCHWGGERIYLGEHCNPYTNERYQLEAHHVEELKALDVNNIERPTDFWLLQQTDDEVLDYRQAVSRFAGAKQTVEQGGDHSFVGFERFTPSIIDFLAL